MYPIKTPKKLIEVALPLDAINAACAHEKQPGIGAHPRGIHLWWARRPLAAARAVIFAQMINDPGYQQGGGFKYGVNKEKAAAERERGAPYVGGPPQLFFSVLGGDPLEAASPPRRVPAPPRPRAPSRPGRR